MTKSESFLKTIKIGGTKMNKIEMKRQVKFRLGIIKHATEVTGNISKTCRYF